MDDRARVAHLLRRFGLGAGKTELDIFAPLGVDGAISRLINYESVPEQFPATAWEFMAYEDGKYQLDPPQVTGWWALRMLLSQRPLEQRLTLLWHDHFSVSGEKVFDAPMMLQYLEVLRQNASGDFRKLLHQISRTPALLFYLDTHLSTKFKPNENFARELLELFTLGQGNYSEKDIQEAARAFTGWSIHYGGIGLENDFDALRQNAAKEGHSIFSFCEVPDLHDPGEKLILGQRGNFAGGEVLDITLAHAATPKFIATKLVNWLVGEGATTAMVDKIAAQLRKDEYQFRPSLRFIAESPEFWSENTIRKNAKSPVDFTVALFRQFGVGDVLRQLRGKPGEPVRKEIKDISLGLGFLMSQQGLLLLYPPNVGGWEWGKAWITSTNMTSRWGHAKIVFQGDDPNRPIAAWIGQRILKEFNGAIVDGFLDIFDGDPTTEQRAVLKGIADKHGKSALSDKDRASELFVELGTALFAMPSYQMC